MKQQSEPEKAERITSDKEERIGAGWKSKNKIKIEILKKRTKAQSYI